MKYIPPKKLKIIMLAFFVTGALGIIVGLFIKSPNSFMITFLGVINICLGGFVGWIFLTQEPKLRDKRKKK
ncbi:MAG: hypothetical protein ACE5RJ_02875 [Nitrosopumilaceae archaeon]